MTAFIIRRLLYGALLLLGVVILNFFLIRLAPGDPAEVIAGDMGGATAEMLASIRAEYGLDQPLLTQLFAYLGGILRGDLGQSYFFNQPVTTLIGARIGPTILLVVAAQVVAITVGTAMGVFAARKPNGVFSGVVTVIATIGYAVPVFWLGIMLLILLASIIPAFPVAGMEDVRLRDATWLAQMVDILHHLFLPALSLAVIFLAIYARLARASMIDVLGADYIRTARAKGASERSVLFHHALRNAALPIITVAGLQFGALISGAVLVETVFNWPGLGTLAFDAILRRDYTTILGILFFAAIMVVIANLVTDLCYRLADPRLREKL
ncbi:ABC transporter permease [Pikeienuella sp. HZG-20]|uniref:ABC transporter permease n=1 Tax=Paludibacillus litoralis TaxID=3133267 RepID=UPI0030EE60DC